LGNLNHLLKFVFILYFKIKRMKNKQWTWPHSSWNNIIHWLCQKPATHSHLFTWLESAFPSKWPSLVKFKVNCCLHRGVPFSFSSRKNNADLSIHSDQQRCRCVPGALFCLPRDNRPHSKSLLAPLASDWSKEARFDKLFHHHRISFSALAVDGCPNALFFFTLRCDDVVSLSRRRWCDARVVRLCALDAAVLLGKQNAAAPWP